MTLEQQEIEVLFNSLHSLSHVRLFGTHRLQHARLPCPSPTPGACSNSCPSNPSYPLLSPFPPAFSLSQHQGLFQWVSSSHQLAKSIGVSASASVLPMNSSEVAQSCPTLCDPVDCSLPGFSVHGILQARILEWVTISFSRGSSRQGSNPGLPHWRQTL